MTNSQFPENIEIKKSQLRLTRIGTSHRAHNLRTYRLKILHICLHAEMSKQEISYEGAEDHRDKNVSIVAHHGQHDRIADDVVTRKE